MFALSHIHAVIFRFQFTVLLDCAREPRDSPTFSLRPFESHLANKKSHPAGGFSYCERATKRCISWGKNDQKYTKDQTEMLCINSFNNVWSASKLNSKEWEENDAPSWPLIYNFSLLISKSI